MLTCQTMRKMLWVNTFTPAAGKYCTVNRNIMSGKSKNYSCPVPLCNRTVLCHVKHSSQSRTSTESHAHTALPRWNDIERLLSSNTFMFIYTPVINYGLCKFLFKEFVTLDHFQSMLYFIFLFFSLMSKYQVSNFYSLPGCMCVCPSVRLSLVSLEVLLVLFCFPLMIKYLQIKRS